MTDCGWPFHGKPDCDTCAHYETLYGEGLTEWLDQKAEIREAAKRERMERKAQGQ